MSSTKVLKTRAGEYEGSSKILKTAMQMETQFLWRGSLFE